jgi:hypothetical protein
VSGLPFVKQDELPDEVVEDASQIVDHVPEDDPPAIGVRLLEHLCPDTERSGITVELADDSMRVALDVPNECILEIVEMMLGSFLLGPAAFERGLIHAREITTPPAPRATLDLTCRSTERGR